MAVQAHVNPTWKYKWLFMVACLFGFAGWCYYDATVAYPAHNVRVAKFQEFEVEGRLDQWEDYAAEQGWATENPGKEHTEMSIITQFIMMGIVLVLGGSALVMVLWHWGKYLEATDAHLKGANGDTAPFDAITDIDMKRWDSKGIAIVHYDDNGKTGTIKIDDWVFKDGDLVLREVEDRTGLGGPAQA